MILHLNLINYLGLSLNVFYEKHNQNLKSILQFTNHP